MDNIIVACYFLTHTVDSVFARVSHTVERWACEVDILCALTENAGFGLGWTQGTVY